jgi:hypothetical protein
MVPFPPVEPLLPARQLGGIVKLASGMEFVAAEGFLPPRRGSQPDAPAARATVRSRALTTHPFLSYLASLTRRSLPGADGRRAGLFADRLATKATERTRRTAAHRDEHRRPAWDQPLDRREAGSAPSAPATVTLVTLIGAPPP